jgi:uncharacterized coiled-coil DUF342 family protein
MPLLFLSCSFVGVSAEAQETDEEIVTPAHTVEAYRAKARIYMSKAVSFRKEAERHKEVARRFREERDGKGRPANTQADIREMEKRCQALSSHALTLAKDADLLAEFYERHAKALEADAGAGGARQ